MSLPRATRLTVLKTALEQSYRNTIYCASERTQNEDGRIVSKWCGNRWCLACNRVRTARAINRYEPVMQEWEETWFVTLTVPNVSGIDLRDTITGMQKAFTRCKDNMRKSDGIRLRALRKLECTYNPKRLDYHPHFHVITDSREAAEALRSRWLQQYPEASPLAQDVRQADKGALKEFFKYFTKLVAKGTDGRSIEIPPAQLDVIFESMRRRRVYQPVGFTVGGKDEEEEVGTEGDVQAVSRIGELVQWVWEQDQTDWVDHSTGELLTEYEPKEKLREFVEGNKDLGDRLDDAELDIITRYEPHPVRDALDRAKEDAYWKRKHGWRTVPDITRGRG